MSKDIHVLIIEDDLYARDLMTLLLTRDWRTRVVGEAGTEDDVRKLIDLSTQRIDAILVDTEVPGDPEWPFRVSDIIRTLPNPPIILTTATKPNPDVFRRLIEGGFKSYMMKKEVRYSLATAVALATKGSKWVITPDVYKVSLVNRIQLPENIIVLDGSHPVAQLTPRENEVARLAILFNLAHRDLADELIIRADQIAKYVSNAYTKLGLDDVLAGEMGPEIYFQDKVVLRHFREILTRVEGSKTRKKTSDMATLAFHLLTVPELKDIF